ncbi:MAG: GSU3473 family protein [Dissulfurispiraceae bacterium]|jgi:hypothetical protein
MYIISVQYTDGRDGGVRADLLDVLLRENKIAKFFRYSEKRWVTVGSDPIRQNSSINPDTTKRRQSDVNSRRKLFPFR